MLMTTAAQWKCKADILEAESRRDDARVKASAAFLEISQRQRATVHNQSWGCTNDANEMGILTGFGELSKSWKYVAHGTYGECYVSGNYALKLVYGDIDKRLNIQNLSTFNGDAQGAVHEGRLSTIFQRFASGPDSLPGILHCAPVRVAVGTLMSRATGDLRDLLSHAAMAKFGTARIAEVVRSLVILMRNTTFDCTAFTAAKHVLANVQIAVKKNTMPGSVDSFGVESLGSRILLDPAQAICLESPFSPSVDHPNVSQIFRRTMRGLSYLWDDSDLYSVLFGVWHSLKRARPEVAKERIYAVDVEKMRLEFLCDLVYQTILSQKSLADLDLIQCDLKNDNLLVTSNSYKTYDQQVKDSRDPSRELGIYPVRGASFTLRDRMTVCGTARVSPVHLVSGDLGSIRVLGREQTLKECNTPLPSRRGPHGIPSDRLRELQSFFVEGTPQGSSLAQALSALDGESLSYIPTTASVVMSIGCLLEDILSSFASPVPPSDERCTQKLRQADEDTILAVAAEFLNSEVVRNTSHAYEHTRLVVFDSLKQWHTANTGKPAEGLRQATYYSAKFAAEFFDEVQLVAGSLHEPVHVLKKKVSMAIRGYSPKLRRLTRTDEQLNGTEKDDSPKAKFDRQYASSWNQMAKSQSVVDLTLHALNTISREFKAFVRYERSQCRLSDAQERLNLSSRIMPQIDPRFDACPLGFLQALNGAPLSGADFESFAHELDRLIKYKEATREVVPSLLEIISRCGQSHSRRRPTLQSLLDEIRTIYDQVEYRSRI